MNKPTTTGLLSFIDIFVDPSDDRLSYVHDLRSEIVSGEVTIYTLDRAIVQLRSHADRSLEEWKSSKEGTQDACLALEHSISYPQYANLLSDLRRPIVSTTITETFDRSTVTIQGSTRQWTHGEPLRISHKETYHFDRSIYGPSFRQTASAFASVHLQVNTVQIELEAAQ